MTQKKIEEYKKWMQELLRAQQEAYFCMVKILEKIAVDEEQSKGGRTND